MSILMRNLDASPSNAMQAWIEGVSVIAPGLPSWAHTSAVLRGEQALLAEPTQLLVPTLLPAAERRRASRVVKLALGLGVEAAIHAGLDVADLATVFSASGADGHNCDALCAQLATEDRQISPTRFHNSVHNAAAGYWGIASRSMAPCQVLCAYDASFGAGLLEAMAQVVFDQIPVLLIAYDSEYPEPLFSKRPIPDCAGVALLLTPLASEKSLACIELQPSTQVATKMSAPALEQLRTQVPALRALPLLQALAKHQTQSVCLDYLPPMQLLLKVSVC